MKTRRRQTKCQNRPALTRSTLFLVCLGSLLVKRIKGQDSTTRIMTIDCDIIQFGQIDPAPSIYGLKDCHFVPVCLDQPIPPGYLNSTVTEKDSNDASPGSINLLGIPNDNPLLSTPTSTSTNYDSLEKQDIFQLIFWSQNAYFAL